MGFPQRVEFRTDLVFQEILEILLMSLLYNFAGGNMLLNIPQVVLLVRTVLLESTKRRLMKSLRMIIRTRRGAIIYCCFLLPMSHKSGIIHLTCRSPPTVNELLIGSLDVFCIKINLPHCTLPR